MIRHGMIYSPYLDWTFDLARAEGDFIWTQDGKKLIDFTSGWNTTNLGWNNPEVAAAMIAQIQKNTYTPMWAADDAQREYAAALTKALPAGLGGVGRGTGGTEANEMAIKTARAYTGRRKIIGFLETYHGQSATTMAIGMPAAFVQDIVPSNPDFVQLEYPQTYRTSRSPAEVLSNFAIALEQALSGRDVAAIVTEAGIVTGFGSCYVAPPGYLALLRRLADKYGTLVILDEVGTGFSRCGSLFGMELDGIIPDIVTFAKGIANGAIPIGTMVAKTDIAEATFAKTILVSTFGWTSVACAAAQRTLQIHQRDKVWEKSRRDGEYIVGKLKSELAQHPKVGDIRGKGLELGIDIVQDRETREKNPAAVETIVRNALRCDLHIVCDHASTIQLMPPLTIDRKSLDEGLARLIECINAVL